MRNSDIKKNAPKHSLMYYMRNVGISQGATQKSPFVNLDTRNKLLKGDDQKDLKYVVCGSASGFCIFKRPVQQKYIANESKKEADFNKLNINDQEE